MWRFLLREKRNHFSCFVSNRNDFHYFNGEGKMERGEKTFIIHIVIYSLFDSSRYLI